MTIDEREQDERHERDGSVKQIQSPPPARADLGGEVPVQSRQTFRHLTLSGKVRGEDHEVRPHRRDHRSAREDLGPIVRLAKLLFRAKLDPNF